MSTECSLKLACNPGANINNSEVICNKKNDQNCYWIIENYQKMEK